MVTMEPMERMENMPRHRSMGHHHRHLAISTHLRSLAMVPLLQVIRIRQLRQPMELLHQAHLAMAAHRLAMVMQLLHRQVTLAMVLLHHLHRHFPLWAMGHQQTLLTKDPRILTQLERGDETRGIRKLATQIIRVGTIEASCRSRRNRKLHRICSRRRLNQMRLIVGRRVRRRMSRWQMSRSSRVWTCPHPHQLLNRKVLKLPDLEA
mmetsp:Transcript_94069/g.148735  ORF Transcript_94069/g.148735 Transcript_94069/m.148735 type:complete len:207 (+) Transcript_94069:56-676(+)